jgi:DNA modification methylase
MASKLNPLVDVTEVITDDYAIYNTDCVKFASGLPDNCMDMVIYSPPFRGLYNYSSDPEDMSNCDSPEQFYTHYDFLIEQLARVTKPGRANLVHVCEIPDKNAKGADLEDLPGKVIELYKQHGFIYRGRRTIWKEPLGVRLRTMAKDLAHKTVAEDSLDAGIAGADYLLTFIKKGEVDVPVSHETGFDYYAGSTSMPPDILKYRNYVGKQTENKYSQWIWRQYASSVWMDIRLDRVLPYKPARDEDDERHVHPLQLDVIERGVQMYTNPGEKVFTPFLGVGSEAYGAVSLGRKAVGCDTKKTYFKQAAKNLEQCQPVQFTEVEQPELELAV